MDADIAHEVATHMDATGVCRYAPVCVAAAVAARSEAIWKILALRDHEIAEELLSRWPQFIAGRYRLLYRRLKESRRYCEVMPASSIIAARDVPPSTESYLLTIQLRHNNNHRVGALCQYQLFQPETAPYWRPCRSLGRHI